MAAQTETTRREAEELADARRSIRAMKIDVVGMDSKVASQKHEIGRLRAELAAARVRRA